MVRGRCHLGTRIGPVSAPEPMIWRSADSTGLPSAAPVTGWPRVMGPLRFAVATRPHPAVGLHVVETSDGLAFLGTVRKRGSVVTVKSGLVGRPAVLHLDEIMSITAAQEHPDVDTDDRAAAALCEGVAVTWLRGLAVDIVAHESCRGCRVNAAQALHELGLLHLLGEAGLADPRTEPDPRTPRPQAPTRAASPSKWDEA